MKFREFIESVIIAIAGGCTALVLFGLVVQGCGIGGDPGGHVPARGAIQKAVREGENAHLISCAKAYEKLANELENDKVIDCRQALRSIESDEAAAHRTDIYELNKILIQAAETEKFGKRQIKTIRAVANAYREAANNGRNK